MEELSTHDLENVSVDVLHSDWVAFAAAESRAKEIDRVYHAGSWSQDRPCTRKET